MLAFDTILSVDNNVYDTINHQLFNIESLELILNYLSNCWQRTKISISFSSWAELLCGVPRGSVLGSLFNIFLNYLFYEFTNTKVCNIPDNTTPYACDIDLSTLLRNLEQIRFYSS